MYQSPGSIPPSRRWWSAFTDPPQRRRADWWRLGVLVLVFTVVSVINSPWDFSRAIPRAGVLIMLSGLSGAIAEVLPPSWRHVSTVLRVTQVSASLIASGVFIGMMILT